MTFVLWAYERHGQDLGVSVILGCFLTGGTLGVLGASAMEYHLLHPSLRMFVGVGLIEEAVKLGVLMFVLRRQVRPRGMRAGLVLGATVGFGFAALESAGYVFDAAVSTDGIDLRALLETEILRGVLAPFGHGLWTAIAGGVLLSYRRPNGTSTSPGRSSAPVSASRCCTPCGTRRTASRSGWWRGRAGTGLDRQLFAEGYIPQPTERQEHLFTLFSVGGLVLVSLFGIARVRSPARRDPSWIHTP